MERTRFLREKGLSAGQPSGIRSGRLSADPREHELTGIEDTDWLFRRLHAACFKKNGTLTSATFKLNGFPENDIWVDLARLTTPTESVNRAGKPGFQLGTLQARGPRQLGFNVVHDPQRFPDTPERDNELHSRITGDNTGERCRELAKLVTVVAGIEPDGA